MSPSTDTPLPRLIAPTAAALLALAFSVFFSACSSLRSVPYNEHEPSKGLTYYLPSRNFIVSIGVNYYDTVSEVTVEHAPIYPDLCHRYSFRPRTNRIFGGRMLIGVNTNGLLESQGITTSKELRQLSHMEADSDLGFSKPKTPSCRQGTYAVEVPIQDTRPANCNKKELKETLRSLLGHEPKSEVLEQWHIRCPKSFLRTIPGPCGTTIQVRPFVATELTMQPVLPKPWPVGQRSTEGTPRILDDAPQAASNCPSTSAKAPPGYGVYYRQNKPYLVKVTWPGGERVTKARVDSPSLSDTEFLPIERRFLGSRDLTLGFVSGVPTTYEDLGTGALGALQGLIPLWDTIRNEEPD